jgi:hypothetical protein
VLILSLAMLGGLTTVASGQETPQLGGSYSSLDARRQKLVADWVTRFNAATKQNVEAAAFYDGHVKLSTKTTFDAITYALERTTLTDDSGQPLGDALDLVEHVESTRGELTGASGDRQFRMYAVLTPTALDTLGRSKEFERIADNTVYHKGYPINYRQQGGAPSIQISVALDRRRADIDVDYRSSSFPVGLFNGHLTSANSDVRAGSNYDRHTNRWTGFQNWWRSFWGVRVAGAPPPSAVDERSGLIPSKPRIGDQKIEEMVNDFLKAWLVDGDMLAAMSYVSDRSYACVAQDGDDPLSVDRGIAPFVLLSSLKAAKEALGPRTSLNDLTVGVNLPIQALRVVNQPHHAQFVIYSVPDDIAARFDCESRVTLGDPKTVRRKYGNYFGATFYVNAPDGKNHSVALLWGKDGEYWKIVSWKSEPAGEDTPLPDATPEVKIARVKADPSLVQAARGFLESWLIRKDYDTAFRYLSPKSYACYNLNRPPNAPAANSPGDAGREIRAALERSGNAVRPARRLNQVVEGVQAVNPAVRILDHPDSGAFALASVPDALAEVLDCAAPERRQQFNADSAPVYGQTFGMNIRFLTKEGEAPVVRMLWLKEADAWRITVYGVELP